ncbi:DUF817 domain-containing protein [Microbacterium sp. NPDC057650]|uniref:DUF817 domain-containing protein n=1 Tax=unclassified Microbacterium TaxID=2609290 RepID=UPI00366F85F6
MQRGTSLERRIDVVARRVLQGAPHRGIRAGLIEFAVFLLKQAWACIFGASLLVLIIAARLWYPDDALLARNDALTVAAVLIQVVMITFRLETGRELWVIVIFHITGTVMELFKTDVGSWEYAAGGYLHLGAVPLFSGFMYGAVGSYMVRVHRLFDLAFTRYPRRWMTVVLGAAIYANFFMHHFWIDLRWVLIAAVVVLWIPTTMYARSWRVTLRLPLLAVFAGVAVFIYAAENIGTWAGAWSYPNQAGGWELVSPSKLTSWFQLMIISVVLVTLVYPPRVPERAGAQRSQYEETPSAVR